MLHSPAVNVYANTRPSIAVAVGFNAIENEPLQTWSVYNEFFEIRARQAAY